MPGHTGTLRYYLTKFDLFIHSIIQFFGEFMAHITLKTTRAAGQF